MADIIIINGKIFRAEYFNKCEYCDMIDTDGKCMMPDVCERNFVFKRISYDD